MPIWCPQCHAMLPESLEECPRCGARLGKVDSAGSEEEGFSRADMFWYSAYTIGIVLIPFFIVVVVGLLCVWLFSR